MLPAVLCLSWATLAATQMPAASGRVGRVLVVAAADDPASLEIALAYRRARRLPPANLLLLSPGHPIEVTPDAFRRQVLDPFNRRWNQLASFLDYAVLIRGIPYRTGKWSAPTVLMFGGRDKVRPGHGFFLHDHPFDPGADFCDLHLHPATVISGYTVDDALKLIDRSTVRYPDLRSAGVFCLCEGRGARGVRNNQIDAGLAMLTRAGAVCRRVSRPSVIDESRVLFQFTGAARLRLDAAKYVPGSVLDNLTSFGGRLLEANPQTSILEFVRYGGCGGYGTVSEPTNRLTRWANVGLLVRYAGGANLMDAYLSSVLDWKYGLVVGDPLMAPFAADLKIDVTGVSGSVQARRAQQLRVHLKGAKDTPPVVFAEAWLDDRFHLAEARAFMPAGNHFEVQVRDGPGVLWKHGISVRENLPLSEWTARFANSAHLPAGFRLRPCGRRRDRLVLRVNPTAAGLSAPDRLSCRVSLGTGEGRVFRKDVRMPPVPVWVLAAGVDFGSAPPAAGDAVRIDVGEESAGVAAESGETLSAFLERVCRTMQDKFAEFAPERGEWQITAGRRKTGKNGEMHWLLLVWARSPRRVEPLPLRVTVHRVNGSLFAPGFRSKVKWKFMAKGVECGTLIVPVPRTGVTDFAVPIPEEVMCPGTHTLLVRAVTSGGNEYTLARKVVAVDGRAAPVTRIARPGGEAPAVLEIRDTDFSRSLPRRVIVDGVLWKRLAPGIPAVPLAPDLPVLCPGWHDAVVEWRRPSAALPEIRSRALRFYIRHPLLAGSRYTVVSGQKPSRSLKTLTAGTPFRLRFQGPYLRTGLTVRVAEHVGVLVRSRRIGLYFETGPLELQAGRYPITLSGDPAREIGGVLSKPLRVAPAPVGASPGAEIGAAEQRGRGRAPAADTARTPAPANNANNGTTKGGGRRR